MIHPMVQEQINQQLLEQEKLRQEKLRQEIALRYLNPTTLIQGSNIQSDLLIAVTSCNNLKKQTTEKCKHFKI